MSARSLLAWAAVLPFAAWAIVRVSGLAGRGTWGLELITATPFVAAASVPAAALALALRRRAAAIVGASAAAVLVLTVLPRVLPDGNPTLRDAVPLTVMSINLDDGHGDAGDVVSLVREHEVDVLVLLEQREALTALAEAGISKRLRFVETARSRAGGSAVLSRVPLRRLVRPLVRSVEEPPRVSLQVGDAALELWPMHPPHPSEAREWRERLAALPTAGRGDVPVVVAGDFNATLDHEELDGVLDRGYRDGADVDGAGLSMTWPSDRLVPMVAIDHILVDERLPVESFETAAVRDTDHRAVIAKILVAPLPAASR